MFMYERVGNNVIERVVGMWAVEGMIENDEHLMDVCGKRALFLENTFFQHKLKGIT